MSGHVLVTGGAGFIGTNLSDRLLREGERVVVLDNLSRAGVSHNLEWLLGQHGSRVRAEVGDVRDRAAIRRAMDGAKAVFHFAAQVAVTTSLVEPINDFEVNAYGTLNVLEEARRLNDKPPVIFTSTNKVYGGLEDVGLKDTGERYEPQDLITRSKGISEERTLDFHSPYGCSKGAADQYVVDYARTMDVPGIVFRMSCIYGPHQFGTEDQGWVAHFLIRALEDQPITLYGDGKQVRDILFVEDLVEAFLLAWRGVDKLQGQAFNIGGGPSNAVSLRQVLALIGELSGNRPDVTFESWRPGDQRYYVSDVNRFCTHTGWSPKVSATVGIARLFQWLCQNRSATGSNATGATLL